MPGYILIADPKGNILYASEGVQANTGFSVKEILGKNPGKVWGGQMTRDFYKNLWNTIEVKKLPFQAAVKNRMKAGKIRWENIHISPVLNAQGKVEYYIEVHPHFKTRSEKAKFKKQFAALMQRHDLTPEQVLPQLFKWIGPTGENEYLTELESFAKEYQDLPTLLNDLFLTTGEMARLEDKRLLAMVEKDPNQFERLYKKYKNKVYNYLLYRLGKNPVIAEELMQETFERAFYALKTFVLQENTYLSYLLVIAHNLLVNHYRKVQLVFMEDLSQLSIATAFQKEEKEPEREEELLRLWTFLETCSPLEKEVMTLKYREGWKVDAIAKRFWKSENAIKLILSRTRKKMREGI